MVRLGVDSVDKNTPNLKMLDANIPVATGNTNTRSHIDAASPVDLATFTTLEPTISNRHECTAIISHRHANQCFAAVDHQPPPPTHLSGVGLSVSQVIDLSFLILHPAAVTTFGRAGGREPTVTISCDILCRDDSPGVVHSMSRRRHCMCRPAALGEAIKCRLTCHPTCLDRLQHS
ncbi:hypothetical protein EVAR_99937_1 [Eumeta japonica]|uniref:Uncharacterized protein n=1 Tax=Eumeta variegata TaxID=151549 RepID=A0A4C1Z0V6_EUMVA|nr:hypothetical protein EVAR_99937_1 [Eumeta japonica]